MFLASTSQKVLFSDASIMPAKDVIKMATRGGAKAMFLEDKIGQLKEGYQADIIRISISEPHWRPHTDLISHLVYSGQMSDVVMTMVAGNILYENGSYYIGRPIEKIYDECQKAIDEILVKAKQN